MIINEVTFFSHLTNVLLSLKFTAVDRFPLSLYDELIIAIVFNRIPLPLTFLLLLCSSVCNALKNRKRSFKCPAVSWVKETHAPFSVLCCGSNSSFSLYEPTKLLNCKVLVVFLSCYQIKMLCTPFDEMINSKLHALLSEIGCAPLRTN